MCLSLLNNKFDNLFKNNGIPCNELIVVGSKIYSGSSLLNISIGASLLRQNFKILHINLEGIRNIDLKYLSNLSDISIHKIKHNNLNKMEMESIHIIMNRLREQLTIITPSIKKMNYNSMINLIHNELRKTKYDLIIIDYIQLLDGNDDYKHIKDLQKFCKQNNISIITPMKMSKDIFELNSQKNWNNLDELKLIKNFMTIELVEDVITILLIKEQNNKIHKLYSNKVDFNTMNCLKTKNYAENIIKIIDNIIKY